MIEHITVAVEAIIIGVLGFKFYSAHQELDSVRTKLKALHDVLRPEEQVLNKIAGSGRAALLHRLQTRYDRKHPQPSRVMRSKK